MNVYDSDRMIDVLASVGYSVTEKPNNADMLIINTCHIREQASEKLFSELGRLRNIKIERQNAGKPTIIAVAGCVAQAAGDEIFNRAPYVDIVLGPQTYHRLPEMVLQAIERNKKTVDKGIIDVEFPIKTKFEFLPNAAAKGFSAFLSVQEGCNKFCTFCVVPYTRGPEYSRPVEDIIFEANNLVRNGAKELILLGQNVNAYHGEKTKSQPGTEAGLGYLLRALAEIGGLERMRYITSHPVDMDDDLIAAHREVSILMPLLHLPVQSGSNHVLKKMNRRHKIEDYYRISEKLLAQRSDTRFSSDFIVGFPGESDEDFEDTLKLVRQIKFIQSYSFKYSKRPGTPGALMENQISEKIKSERLDALQGLLKDCQTNFNQDSLNTVVPVLFDRRGKENGQLVGRSPFMQPVHVTAPEHYLGQIVNVKLVNTTSTSLGGEIDFKSELEQETYNTDSNFENSQI